MPELPPESRSNAKKFQFSVRRLLLMTTAVAGVVGIAWSADASDLVRAIIAAYLAFLALWAIFAGPWMVDQIQRMRRCQQELQRRRAAMAERLGEARRGAPQENTPDDGHE